MNKRVLWVGGALVAGVVLAGCTLPGSTTQQASQVDINVTLVGTLSEGAGGIFLLKTADKGVVQLHNAAAKLEGFVGQRVTVTGQYSGTTLYVDRVNVN